MNFRRVVTAVSAAAFAVVPVAASLNASASTAPEASVDRDATLRVGWSLAPRMMDPHRANTIGDYPFLSLVYDRLINLSPTEELEPMLATEWSFVDDGAALEMSLREGVTFQDGEPFDAEAVKANIERAQTLETSTLVGILEPITGIEVVDDYTVRFDLAPGEGGGLPYAFAERPGMMISPAAFDDPTLDQYGVGTGPYVVKEGTFQAAQQATFVRAPGEYWNAGQGDNFAEIEMIAMPEQNTRLNALQSGQIDLAPIAAASSDDAISLGESDEFDTELYPARTYYFVTFNLDRPELQDVRVRQAIAMAIDKEGLASAVFSGHCATTSQMPLEGDAAYLPELEDLYSYDPDGARSLLAEAGVPELDLTGVLITTEPMTSQNIALQAMFAEVGINWDLSATMSSQEGLPAWSDGQFDMHGYIAAGRADPVSMYVESRDRNLPGGMPEGAAEALEAAQNPALSADEQAAALQDLNRIMVEQYGFVYICHPQEALVGRSNLIGLDESPWMRYGVYDVQSFAAEAG